MKNIYKIEQIDERMLNYANGQGGRTPTINIYSVKFTPL